MKSPWTRLAILLNKKKNLSEVALQAIFNNAFERHHRYACEMVVDNNGDIMAAIYFSPKAVDTMDMKKLFIEIRNRTVPVYELNEKESRN